MSEVKNLKNVITAMITPFKPDLTLDETKYREFIRFQLENGCHVLTMGTTGESATMSHEEHHQAMDIAVNEVRNYNPKSIVMAGTGSNSTKESISLSKYAENAGIDVLLLVVPYYNKPAQHSLIDHFSAIAKSVSLPIFLYNVPSRTGTNLEPFTVEKLVSKNENIIGMKCASGNIDQITKLISITPEDFIIFSGDDALTYHIMGLGGKGVISVASNIIPKRLVEFTNTMNEGNWTKAREMQFELYDIFKVLFIETNPGPVKYAAEKIGIMDKRMRLPLTPPLKENEEKINKILSSLNLI
jgi:4-hydroxy-tetrahydrodipicolinate synthase